MITADKKDIDDNLKQLMDSIITRYLEDYSINPENSNIKIQIEAMFERYRLFDYDCKRLEEKYHGIRQTRIIN